MTTEYRILKAKSNKNSVLAELCRQWQETDPRSAEICESGDFEPSNDPVADITKLRKLKIYALLTAYVCELILLLHYGMNVEYGSRVRNPYILHAVWIPVFLVICAMWVKYIWPHRTDSLENTNAMDFIRAIETVEEVTKKPFSHWNLPEVFPQVRSMLMNSATPIDASLSDSWPTLTSDAVVALRKWKKTYSLIERVFPELPKNNSEFFPKLEDATMAHEVSRLAKVVS